MIPKSTQELITRWRLGHIATITPGGFPSVSPKGTFLVIDDRTIGFGDIRSPGTLSNLAANPAVEVNFVDPFTRKGVRLAGSARILPRGSAEFDALWPRWHATWGGLADRIKALVQIDVTRCLPLSTPPYDDGATEAEMIAIYQQKYAGIYP